MSVRAIQVPQDWRALPIGEIVSASQYGLSHPSDANGSTPIIGMKDMNRGKVLAADWARVSVTSDERERFCLNPGDILLNRTNSNDLVGKVALWDHEEEAVFASYLVRFVIDPREALPRYVNHYLNADDGQRRLKQLATRGVSQANINPTQFRQRFMIALPPLPEQRRIAAVLDAWDDAITTTERLIAAKRHRTAATVNAMIYAHHAFRPIEQIASQTSKTAGRQYKNYLVFSCTKYDGLVLSDDYFDRQTYGSQRTAYKMVAPLEFAYATNHLEEGSIGLNTHEAVGIVSPMYTTFCVDHADPHYIYAVLKTERMRKEFERRTPASVNRRGGLRWKDFAKIEVPLPPLREQVEITARIGTLTDDLRHAERLLDRLRRQKRGLMQKLLTGEWRVPESAEALMPGGRLAGAAEAAE